MILRDRLQTLGALALGAALLSVLTLPLDLDAQLGLQLVYTSYTS